MSNPPPVSCTGTIYTVQPGDTMFSIAAKFGLTVSQLIIANPQIPNPNVIFPGDKICIPSTAPTLPPTLPPTAACPTLTVGSTGPDVVRLQTLLLANGFNPGPIDGIFGPLTLQAVINFQVSRGLVPDGIVGVQTWTALGVNCAAPPTTTPSPTCPGFIYTVVAGDTLSSIAARFGTTVSAILAVNPQITNPNVIFVGQKICIPTVPPTTTTCPGFIYTVVAGDTLSAIAARFGTTVSAILAVNPQITNPNVIFVGQKICIPVVSTTPSCSGFFYTIKAGDTLFLLSQRFGVSVNAIIAANPGINPNNLQIGQVICIPSPTPTTMACPTLSRGSTGPDVTRLQTLLLSNGFNPGPIDGIFGSMTEAAVIAFQSARGLIVDGIVGVQTWTALGVNCA